MEQLTTPLPSEAATQAVRSAVEPMAVATDAVTAIVNAEGSPYMIDSERGTNLGFFYLEPNDALRDLQVITHRAPTP